MLAGALIFAVGASGTPPNVTTDFCCTLEQWVLVNSTSGPLPPPNTTWQPGSRFKLCIDTTNKRWSREGEGVDTQRFNGTDRFTLTKNTSAPGGYNCVQKTFGPPKEPLGMPWQMVDIDVDASADGTETFDGIASVARWVHDRPKKGMFPAGNMTWHIAPGTNPSMLRTSYVTAAEPPAPGFTSGERDFSLNFTTTLPSFNPPPGVVCASPNNTFQPADDCKPACAGGSLCCKDPTVQRPTGACFNVKTCSQLPGGDDALEEDARMWSVFTHVGA